MADAAARAGQHQGAGVAVKGWRCMGRELTLPIRVPGAMNGYGALTTDP
jgi:hypothetical protein